MGLNIVLGMDFPPLLSRNARRVGLTPFTPVCHPEPVEGSGHPARKLYIDHKNHRPRRRNAAPRSPQDCACPP